MIGAPPYAIWRAAREALESESEAASAAWQAIPGAGNGPMGLTPDSVKTSQVWRDCRARYEAAHKALSRFNANSPREYMRKLAADRRAARLAKSGSAAA